MSKDTDVIEIGLRTLCVTGEIDHYKITIGSIIDQYRITNFDQLHIPPKMFVDLDLTIINLTKIHIILNGLIPNITTTTKLVQ